MGEGVVHDGHVDGADGAEILGHHEVRVEPGERTLVEVVEVVPTVHRGGDEVVDLLAGQPFRHRTGRDDGAGAASSGWSHSNVTPTTWSPTPRSKRISVVDG